ncbi:MAG: hypothetical protein IJU82_08230 [Ruminiclostridium sp.]|nr:hypothetical protein [Ruminiclostridium sp.]
MAKRRKGFLVYLDYLDYFEFLSDEQLGKVFRCLFSYAAGFSSIPDDFTDAMNMMFCMMVNNYERDSEAYEKVCEMRSENAKKRWEKTV